jgi:hypothetical protein
MTTLCDDWLADQARKHPKSSNPMVRGYGNGPAGKCCRTCRSLYAKSFAKTYYKCLLRRDSGGAKTDHRVTWDACGKYEEKS